MLRGWKVKSKSLRGPHLKLGHLSSGDYKTVTILKASCPYSECCLCLSVSSNFFQLCQDCAATCFEFTLLQKFVISLKFAVDWNLYFKCNRCSQDPEIKVSQERNSVCTPFNDNHLCTVMIANRHHHDSYLDTNLAKVEENHTKNNHKMGLIELSLLPELNS